MWQDVERPGFLGKNREVKYAQWDKDFGKGNWRLIWKFGGWNLDFWYTCLIYEEAYFYYMKRNPKLVEDLVDIASNVYDDAPSNVDSGCNYLIQETQKTHIQDIAIRRVLKRMKKSFKGNKLIRIRHDKGDQPFSMILSPGIVPFHKPSKIIKPWLDGSWWEPGTVECFYQSNRMLQKKYKLFERK